MKKGIPTISYKEFKNTQRKKRWPQYLTIELTSTCNLRCVHCYLGHRTTIASAKKKELNLQEMKTLLDDLADHGCFKLLLTGGEPLTRKDFYKIYDYAFKKDFLILLFTNATLVDEKTVAFLKDHPPQLIDTTAYGMTQDTYESITRVPGSFKRFWNGVNLMFDHSLPLGIKTVVLQQNKHEISQYKKFCEDKKIQFRIEPHIIARMNLDRTPFEYRVSPEETVELLYKYGGPTIQWEIREKLLNICGGGRTTGYITSTGHLQCCYLVRQFNVSPTTDLRKTSFEDAWKKLPRRLKTPVEEKCKDCEAMVYCDQCPARAYLSTGRKDTVDEFDCRYARAKYDCIHGKTKIK